MALEIAVIVGSVRSQRVGIRVARYVVRTLTDRGHHPVLIDPVEHSFPLLDKMYKEYPAGQAPEPLERVAAIIKAADAYVVVSGEYNHSIPPALSNLLDHFLEEYYFKPSAIVCYSGGAYGGVRAAMQLRVILAEMGMSSIPSILPFPKARDTMTEEGVRTDTRGERAAEKFFSELEWYTKALKTARAAGRPY